jgi:hypothetical protein
MTGAKAELPDGDDSFRNTEFQPGVPAEGDVNQGIAVERVPGPPLEPCAAPLLPGRMGRAAVRAGAGFSADLMFAFAAGVEGHCLAPQSESLAYPPSAAGIS